MAIAERFVGEISRRVGGSKEREKPTYSDTERELTRVSGNGIPLTVPETRDSGMVQIPLPRFMVCGRHFQRRPDATTAWTFSGVVCKPVSERLLASRSSFVRKRLACS